MQYTHEVINMLIPVRTSKVSSNKRQELVYIPKMAVRVLKLRKDTNVAIYINTKENCLIIRPIEIEDK